MIVHLKPGIDKNLVEELAKKTSSVFFKNHKSYVLVTSSKTKEIPAELENAADSYFVLDFLCYQRNTIFHRTILR